MFDLKSFVDPEDQSKKLITSNNYLENEINNIGIGKERFLII